MSVKNSPNSGLSLVRPILAMKDRAFDPTKTSFLFNYSFGSLKSTWRSSIGVPVDPGLDELR
jgi:hypothetical protein